MIKGEPVYINGDGVTSRDFCYIENVIQANQLAASTQNTISVNQVYNIALGGRTTLNELYLHIKQNLKSTIPYLWNAQAFMKELGAGDVLHSLDSIQKARA